MALISKLSQQEQLNFLLTNRVPRYYLTRFMGWFSKIESPLLTRLSISIWKLFANDLDFSESRSQTFNSLQDCFTRRLKDGARTIDRRDNIIVSPCDAIVGAFGKIENGTVYQAKGFPYQIAELINDENLIDQYRDGFFITLRLTSSMYHRFHAPVDCTISEVNYISGDTWNVNPVALKRIEKLYCKNERAVINLTTRQTRGCITMVPVAAILVASMKILCLDEVLDLKYRGENRIPCDAEYKKGDEMGYFQHGSTIILFASSHYQFFEGIFEKKRVRMGQALLSERNKLK